MPPARLAVPRPPQTCSLHRRSAIDALACPAGFYCANYADATVGARCLPLPPSAGKEGGPCMPSNYPVRVLRGVCVRACPSLSRTALPSRRSALLLPLSLLPLDTT